MALIVQKFGGTSVGTAERIKSIAGRIAAFKVAGHQLVVVVSAMSGETNRLVALAKEIQLDPDPREFGKTATCRASSASTPISSIVSIPRTKMPCRASRHITALA